MVLKQKRKGKEKEGGPTPKKNMTNYKEKNKWFVRKKDKAKMKCYNRGTLGYFVCECSKQKKIAHNLASRCDIYIISSVLLTESYPLWIVDSGVIDYVAEIEEHWQSIIESHLEQDEFMWKIMLKSRSKELALANWICVVADLCSYMMSYTHPKFDETLIFIVVLLGFDFHLNFRSNGVDLFNDSIHYGSSYVMNDFIIMDVECYMYNYDNNFFHYISLLVIIMWI